MSFWELLVTFFYSSYPKISSFELVSTLVFVYIFRSAALLFGCIESPFADVSKLLLKYSYSNDTFNLGIRKTHCYFSLLQ